MSARRSRILAAVSLILLALLAFAWARSYLPIRYLELFTHRGNVVIVVMEKRYLFADPDSEGFGGVEQMLISFRFGGSGASNLGFLGIESMSGVIDGPNRYWVLLIPFPFLVLPAAAVAFYFVRAARTASRRAREKRCPDCGYDLRESPQRCPECGRANPFKLPASASS